ncbi:MAG: exonuclease domain-containing protein [Thiotrichaceae bacterium]|nr:exonuclease domain-containing protein [Thiotrichaceae bacterium]
MFLVIDTEGKDILTEIAIIDIQGIVIYEAYDKEHPNNADMRLNLKTLAEITDDIQVIMAGNSIVCHYAEHDAGILRNSFKKVGKVFENLTFLCTYELSKIHFIKQSSYSLDFLCKHFNLKVEGKRFNSEAAHRAKYDALFTYQLYRYILQTELKQQLHSHSNPFGHSRVDTPFQEHPDLTEICHNQFVTLTATLDEIKQDQNHQSKGVVVIGEAGTGKTHLMMRLAKARLSSNRLLFIRQPNHPDAILYHIYSRILESFVEKVPNSSYSQIEYLLAKSFSKIQIDAIKNTQKITQKGENLLKILSEDPLNIYSLGKENTEVKRRNWQHIEKMTLKWWETNFGFEGYAGIIIRGLVKFCSYSEAYKRDLVRRWLAGNELDETELEKIGLRNWGDNMSLEAFSLEAITVFSKLSLLDEPLIIIFDQLEGLKFHENILFQFGEAVKELFTHVPNSLMIFNLFPDRWQHFKSFFDDSVIHRMAQYQLVLDKPNPQQLKQILNLKMHSLNIEIEQLFLPDELNNILQQHSVRAVLNRASEYYRFKIEDIPLPQSELSFEQEMRVEVQALKREMAMLKKQFMGQTPIELNANQITENKVIYQSDNDLVTGLSSSNPIEQYIQQYQTILEQDYDTKRVIISDSDDIGKLLVILEAFKPVISLEIDQLRLGKRKLPEHISVQTSQQQFVVAFLHVGSVSFAARIKNFNELVVLNKNIRFALFRDAREADIKGKVAQIEIEKLNNAENGYFLAMSRGNRINFELIYKLVTDIQNREIDLELETALQGILYYFPKYWLIRNLTTTL